MLQQDNSQIMELALGLLLFGGSHNRWNGIAVMAAA
jgi:hypothetical protein